MVCVLGLLCGAGFSQDRIYAHLTGVAGESKRAGRADWIDVIGLGTKVSREAGADTSRTSLISKAGPLVFRKQIDKSLPYLLQGMLRGEVFEELELEIEGLSGVETTYRLRGVRLERHEIYSEPNRSELFEEVGFQYDVIEWHDFQNGPNGGTDYVGSTWNFATNEGGILNESTGSPPTIAPISPLVVKPGQLIELKVTLVDAGKDPAKLVFSALSPDEGLVKILGVTGDGLTRTISLQVGDLQNGSDRMTLSVTDGVRSSTRDLPIVIAGDQTIYETYLMGFLSKEMAQDPGVIRPLRDPDGDGISNVMEFFIGTDPLNFTSRDQAFTMTREKANRGTEIRMRYYRRMDEASLVETFEGTSDLNNWQTFGVDGSPAIEITRITQPKNGYALMEARVFIKDALPGGVMESGLPIT